MHIPEQRNAAVAFGDGGTADDIPVLAGALEHDEALMREHAAWALHIIALRDGSRIASSSEPRQVEVGTPQRVREG